MFLSAMDAVKLLVVFALIVLALRRKLSVGVTLFGAGLLTALVYGIEVSDLAAAYWNLLTSRRFISLTALIVLITILGALLKELGFLERLTEACRGLYGGRRTAAALLPPLVGLMPMPGGALLSAPLVESVLSRPPHPPQLKCVINYWYRHVVEHFTPIYPGIIVSEAVTGMPIGKIALLQLPMALVMAVLGIVFFVRKVARSRAAVGSIRPAIKGIALTVWPIFLIVTIYAVFEIEMAWAALIGIALLVALTRPTRDQLYRPLRKGLSYKLVFLVFGILSFQVMLDQSGAVAAIERLSSAYNLPAEAIIVVVAFAAGLLTGMLAALVALSYSLLAGFLYQPVIDPGNILLAFTAGYIGMMFSPTHLCFVLTNEYFKSDFLRCIKLMAVPLIILGLFGYFLSRSFWPELVYP
jgi:integral membrane protein (TIGR00529 family)